MRTNKNKGLVAPPRSPPKPRSNHSQHTNYKYNLLYFDFNIPHSQRSFIHPSPTPSPTPSPIPTPIATEEKTITVSLVESRKELIKQKIKFRVKQELCNLLKRKVELAETNRQKEEREKESGGKAEGGAKRTSRTNSSVYIKGKSSTRFNRDSFLSRKHSEMDMSKSNVHNFSDIFVSKPNKTIKRVWSSAVKMREKDRLQLEKTQSKVTASAANLDKMESYQIEPWKHSQDPEMHLHLE